MSMVTLGLSASSPERHHDPNYRLSVGAVLRRTFSAWTGNLVPFAALSFVFMIPAFVCYVVPLTASDAGPGAKVFTGIGNLIERIVGFLITGAITYGVFQDMRGQRATLAENMRAGLAHAGGVFGASLLTALIILAGMCALFIPAVYAMVALWVAVPVAVVEAPGASAAVSRSYELTTGNRWRVFGIVLVVMSAFFGIAILIGGVVEIVGLGEVEGDAHSALRSEVLATLLLLPIIPLQAISQVVVYHDLRVGREGADVEELVKVFE